MNQPGSRSCLIIPTTSPFPSLQTLSEMSYALPTINFGDTTTTGENLIISCYYAIHSPLPCSTTAIGYGAMGFGGELRLLRISFNT